MSDARWNDPREYGERYRDDERPRVPVWYAVACQKNTGARRTVGRASLSRSLRRLWRIGAVENSAAGVRRSRLGHSTA
jgi:hypothetical protein